jgi:hypothetical protein
MTYTALAARNFRVSAADVPYLSGTFMEPTNIITGTINACVFPVGPALPEAQR